MKKRGSLLKSLIALLTVSAALLIVIYAATGTYLSDAEKKEALSSNTITVASILQIMNVNHQGGLLQGSNVKMDKVMTVLCSNFEVDYITAILINRKTDEINVLCTATSTDNEDIFVLDSVIEEYMEKKGEIWMHPEEYQGMPAVEYLEDMDLYFCDFPLVIDDDSILVVTLEVYDRELAHSVVRNVMSFTLPTLSIVALTVAVALLLVNFKIAKPIKKISSRMINFVDDYKKNHRPIYEKDAPNNEIGDISEAFNKMSSDIEAFMTDIDRMRSERVAAEVELGIARKIQTGIVPERLELDAGIYSVCAAAEAARNMGGDFYECFRVDDRTLCTVIGDVSGKGVSAAVFMSMIKTAIQVRLADGFSPEATLDAVNREVCRANPESMFATVFIALTDTVTGEVHFANGGHNPPVILGESPRFAEVESGTLIGLFDTDCDIGKGSIRLKEGEGLLLYTDGCNEALDAESKFFGTDGMLKAIDGKTTAKDICGALCRAVHRHSGAELSDDVTVVVIYPREQRVMKLKPELSSLDIINGALSEMLGNTDAMRSAALVAEELFANIVTYSGAKDAELILSSSPSSLKMRFSDDGEPFDPSSADPEMKDPDLLDLGGMGIPLVRRMSKSFSYERADGKNIVTLELDLSALQ